mgnify:CR=1 FL=1
MTRPPYRKEPEETPQPSLPDAPRDDADNGAASQTIAPTSPSGFVQIGDVFIKNNSTKALDPAWFDGSFAAALSDDAPQVLIVHTHGSEAYTMPKGQEYAPTGTCRTADNSVNMIRVGDEIAAVLSSYGISVLHDRVLYDDPAYDGAYERAADAIRGYLEKYPTLSFVLDVHRDAIEDKAGHQYKVITREDPRCAQISFVMGSNNDHWLENVKLAVAVQQRLTDTSPTLMRPMTLRNSNYNQHLTTGSMLVEIGTAGNSLSEALRAAQKNARGKRRTALEKAMESDLAQLDSGVMPEAMDKYYGLRYETPATLLDHLSRPIFILDEVGGIRDAQKATEFRRSEELTGLLEEGVICPGLDVLYQTMDDLAIAAQDQSTLLCENFLRGMNEFKLKDLINAEAFAAPNWGGDLASLREDLDPLIQQGYAVALFAGTPKGAAALTRDLADKGYAVSMSRDVRPAKGLVQVLPGHLTAGCTFPFARVAVISSRRHGLDDEAAENKKRKKNKNALSSLSDIKPGDYVVHQSHGIGMYAGIQRLEVQGAIKDYLKIQYSGSDVLYVPVTQLDLLSRYTAPGDEEKVKLAKLGGTEWQRTRAKVKKATEEMAQELIELYARRRQATGYAFPADGEWQSDFESRFEYDETDDQLTATAEIKKDMEKGWPMDRLLCGDVGVGKTEVAFRAAFKCVMGGKQCAILAPTTLLAWQHYNSIISRMEAFPVKVGLLSRFRTAKQQKETLRGLQAGSVDIVVGTHRLLSKDVRFHDLGLVIIDEEQRFGVKHKEKLKENFIGVDMLTLSATPIPRTLNMAMSGIRDLSTIEQPPFERQPVETFVLEYNDVILAEAMKKELARGGQVYYLHNRVENIESTTGRLRQWLGEDVRLAMAHGKMSEQELSRVMQQMADGEVQVLVCTTIIETGIDIPNVNTLIIEDADRLGLAQLHQIRGRIGRSSRRAYAYLTYRPGKVLTEVASKRLSAIREYVDFGAGFRIAMRDLEIRGAGNLLGPEQSGYMMSVGYDMYLKLLNDAVLEQQGKGREIRPECSADLTVAAYIPERYVPSDRQRMDLYRRMAAIRTQADADDLLDEIVDRRDNDAAADLIDELTDRYGDPPRPVTALLDVALLRAAAADTGVTDITQKGQTLLLSLGQRMDVPSLMAVCTLPAYRSRLLLSAGEHPKLTLHLKPGEEALDAAGHLVEALTLKRKEISGETPAEGGTL